MTGEGIDTPIAHATLRRWGSSVWMIVGLLASLLVDVLHRHRVPRPLGAMLSAPILAAMIAIHRRVTEYQPLAAEDAAVVSARPAW